MQNLVDKAKVLKIMILILMITMSLLILSVTIKADTRLGLYSDKKDLEINEEFNVTAEIDKTNIAAFTIWVYFDNEKVECTSKSDNLNVVENRIIYTWFSETGRNKSLTELIELNFKAKENGTASFSVIGEFYNENGEEIDIDYSNLSVNIGNVNEITEQTDDQSEIEEDKIVSDDNANLEIMRLGLEGVNPDFDSNIQEYYLIIDESVESIDVTAIPENRESQVRITGNENLKSGKNVIQIEVTSKDKTNTKNYTINVTKTNNPEKANADLETLAVENYDIIPEFYDNITNYKVEISNNTNKLNILAIPSDTDAKVRITGNENLKEGNNIIYITVTAEDSITTKKYNINVYKRSASEEIEFEKQEQEKIQEVNTVLQKMNTQNIVEPDEEILSVNEEKNETEVNENKQVVDKILMIVGIVLSVIAIGVVVLRIKHKT